ATTAVRLSFICVAVWWAIFSVPLLLFVKEPDRTSNQGDESTVKRAFKQLKLTFSKIRQLRMVFLFLLGYWFYIDGVDTVIRMAVDYGLSLGFDSNVLIVALLVTQFVGFPSAIVFGKLGENIGAKPGIVICIGVYLAITVWAVFIDEVYEFYVMAIAVGLVQGGVQALSRSLYAQIIPQRMAGEFFGFYNMLGKFAAVIGPVLMGWTGLIFGNPRVSILSLAILFIIGAFLLSRVNVEQGQQAAKSI
ncbi:MAG: MFS transporter, partial [Gammaproteobacteria bacterium]|nr:MFS transporter [Gammaproteobacteria bacterium]